MHAVYTSTTICHQQLNDIIARSLTGDCSWNADNEGDSPTITIGRQASRQVDLDPCQPGKMLVWEVTVVSTLANS